MATKYKNPPIWAKFGFQVNYDVANWYPSLVCYGAHFESKMTAKIQKSSDWGEILFYFHWNLFFFEFLTIFLIFILVAILKIFKTKSTTLSDDLFLCQFQKDPLYGLNLTFLHLGYQGNGHHFEFVQPSKAATHYGGYSYKVIWSLMKGIPIFF